MSQPPLRDLQTWFVGAIVSEALPDEDVTACLIDGVRGLDARARLDIYRHAYHARLVECLADDYPVLRYALGAESFDVLAHVYMESYPPAGANLNSYGRNMAAFCRQRPGPWPERDFAVDLARLEWALVEVIHAPSENAEMRDLLANAPPDRFAELRFSPSAAVRLVRSAYPVNAFFQDVVNEKEPEIPESRPSAVLVYRQGLTVWRMDVVPALGAVLEALLGGASLGEALNHLDEGVVDPEAISTAFRQWASSGIFTAVRATGR